MLRRVRSILLTILLAALAAPAAAAPAMFSASFIFHAWGNDVSSGSSRPNTSNDWIAAPLGYDCQHAGPYTANGAPSSRYCSHAKMQRGHPATGMWSRSVGTGSPPAITMQQSDFGVALVTTSPTYTWGEGGCCRGFLPTSPPYV